MDVTKEILTYPDGGKNIPDRHPGISVTGAVMGRAGSLKDRVYRNSLFWLRGNQ
jgi:hypothetical protein